ncbi:MAG TPA: NAD(P)/FAD-dependent oxidoreductase, partial [Prolixibacteraceae bacterium]|nr:NAD(P)/FAD-dependent oxidoreductase [Prolixibacteraceae bacterium]
MKKTIIIGAGISGLATATRLAARGFHVLVLEQSETYGGKIASFGIDGFRFDMGPSLFVLPEQVDELFRLSGRKMEDYLQLQPLSVSCDYHFPNGERIRAWSHPDRFCDAFSEQGGNSQALKKYLERQKFLYQHTSDFFLFRSIHRLSSYLGPAGRKSLKALHRLDAFHTMHYRNQKTFGDGPLTQLFDRYATYNGSDPYRAPATLNMIAHLEHSRGAFFPVTGMRGIVD